MYTGRQKWFMREILQIPFKLFIESTLRVNSAECVRLLILLLMW